MTDESAAASDADLFDAAPDTPPGLSERAARLVLGLAAFMAAATALVLAVSWIDSTSSDATCGSVVEWSTWSDGQPHDCATVMPLRAVLATAFLVAAVVLTVRAVRPPAVTTAWKVTADVVIVCSLGGLIVNEVVRVGGVL